MSIYESTCITKSAFIPIAEARGFTALFVNLKEQLRTKQKKPLSKGSSAFSSRILKK